VTIRLAKRGIGAVLLDIEGTTTPIAFVHDVLFPYARARAAAYLAAHRGTPDDEEIRRRLAAEHAEDVRNGQQPPSLQQDDDPTRGLVPYVEWLMDRDRKSPGLKLLQGLIWEEGYQAGELRGQVYPDVPGAIRRWRDRGLDVAIYSSGSVLAQRRLFESTPAGDLTPLFTAFFDTAVGPKVSASSYARIAEVLGRSPSEILFVSDITRELAAAREAGLHVLLSLRPGNAAQPEADAYEQVTTFDKIE
jgi:enolase-phosphatase E1